MSGRLAGKACLVTGAASGIGYATAELFVREGASVALLDRADSTGRESAARLARAGVTAQFVAADVTREAECAAAVRRAVDDLGGLDILVNNAGVIRRATVADTTEADWDHLMAVNLKAVFLMSKHAIEPMTRRGGGAIVNTASGWGLVGGPRAAAYCASKGGVVQLTRAMAIDHGGANIRVNCVCPGDIDTPLLRGEAVQLGEPLDRFMRDAAARPLGRVGRAAEVAEAILFLASDAAAFVTGTALVVDGGGLAG